MRGCWLRLRGLALWLFWSGTFTRQLVFDLEGGARSVTLLLQSQSVVTRLIERVECPFHAKPALILNTHDCVVLRS